MLGKRKRDTVISRNRRAKLENPTSDQASGAHADDIFRNYFETRFVPLFKPDVATETVPEQKHESIHGVPEEDSESVGSIGSSWSGLSHEGHETTAVEVVDYTGTTGSEIDDPIDRIFQRTFMSAKPPRETEAPPTRKTVESNLKDEDDEDDKTNLKHDLDLQRLLRESHLLEQSKRAPLPGAARHRATDLRLQALGSKASLFAQDKMPMSHRKGIQAKASSQDALRRREAKENGIILEKPSTKKSSARDSRRDRGVDVPVVGKFRGGTLQLSRRDVASIQGPNRIRTKQKGRW